MKQPYSFDQIWQEQPPAGEPGTLTIRQRAERLYRMGELAAATDLLVKETIQ